VLKDNYTDWYSNEKYQQALTDDPVKSLGHDNAPQTVCEITHVLNDRRQNWQLSRAAKEQKKEKTGVQGTRSRFINQIINKIFQMGIRIAKFLGVHSYLINRTKKLVLSNFEFEFSNLPNAFDGYRILHISDPHFDSLPNLEDEILRALGKENCDLVVITGDFTDEFNAPWKHFLDPMRRLIKNIGAPDGFVAVLGNHDSWRIVEPLESLGVHMLINENLKIEKNGKIIGLTGIDDPSSYFSKTAEQFLSDVPEQFNIALVHSAELADVAANSGHSLYLAGHSHGGQICLPGGRAIMTGMQCHRELSKGEWQKHSMQGYTNCGAGVSGMPYRLFSKGEIALITLRCK